MELIVVPYDYFCSLQHFYINGIMADICDFGECLDDDPQNAPDYGCGCKLFRANPAEPEILDKYKISLNEYNEVCEELREKLYFGSCSLCA